MYEHWLSFWLAWFNVKVSWFYTLAAEHYMCECMCLQEKQVVKHELTETQKTLNNIEAKEHQETVEKEKLLVYVTLLYIG